MKGNHAGRPWGMTGTHRRPAALAVLVAVATLALAACTSGSTTPQIASLGNTGGAATGTSPATGNSPAGRSSASTGDAADPDVTPLLNQWAACERSNGDPDQSDPTVDASGVIWVVVPRNAQPAGDLHELTGPCSEYLAKAQNELEPANPEPPPPDQAEQLKYVNCMRANGVPDYPNPTGDTTNFIGSGVDPDSPAFQKANQLCGQKIGAPAWWINGTSTPGSVEVRTAGSPLNPPTAPACVFQKVNPCSGDITKSGTPGPGANG